MIRCVCFNIIIQPLFLFVQMRRLLVHICVISPADITDKTKWGGVLTHTKMLSNILVKEGNEVTLIAPADHLNKSHGKLINNIHVVFTHGIEKVIVNHKWIKNVQETFNKIHEQKPIELVISEGYCAYGLQKKYTNLPIVSFVHNFSFIHFYNNWTEVGSIRSLLSYLLKTIPRLLFRIFRFEIPFYHSTNYTVSCSKLNAGYLRKIYQIPQHKLKIIQNWINTYHFYPNVSFRLECRQRLNIPDNVLVFLLVGSIWRPKGFHIAIQSFSKIVSRFSNAILLICGSGREKEKEHLTELVQQKGIDNKVRFLGEIEYSELPQFYNMADIFLMPSLLSEGHAYTLIEAMACGLPSIATQLGGNIETIGDSGILVPPGDVDALEQAMIELAQNPEKRKELSRLARERVMQYFSEDVAIQKVSSLLTENFPDKIH